MGSARSVELPSGQPARGGRRLAVAATTCRRNTSSRCDLISHFRSDDVASRVTATGSGSGASPRDRQILQPRFPPR
jgi:hypothetical protein